MNKAYRLIWSAVRECWIVVSEKVLSKGCIPAITVGAMTVATLFASANMAHALPGGGQLAAGQATISQPAAGQMNINQTSNRAVINWNSFGIASGETVTISQPSSQSALLNRIVGNSSSEIFGKLNANGQVFLVNPNGVLFGKGASVNVGGLVASSLNIKDNDFMSGNLSFNKDGQAASVINQGEISAGFAALLGPQVSNSGSIIATKGSVALGAADSITLNFDNNGLIALKLDQGAFNAQAGNSGIIEADGGRVLLTAKSADNILKSMVNNSGVIQARTVENHNGQIILLGDMENGTVNVGGTLDATAPKGGSGGFIETSAAKVTIADNAKVTTLSTQGNNGTWLIDPDGFTIASTGGDMTGAQVQTALAGGNFSILSVNGNGADGNINVNDTISWNANKLTLTATNDININNIMTASGTSTLALVAANRVNCALDPTTGVFTGKVDFPGRSGAGILTINGAGYTVINSLGAEGSATGLDLQGMNGNLTGRYVLGSDINAGATSGWTGGFTPVGNVTNAFGGTFNGLGHVVNGLTINRVADNQGLFGMTKFAVLSNVSLTNASISGRNYIGGLIGQHLSGTTNIYNSFVGGTVTGTDYAGGVVGYYNGGNSGGAKISGISSGVTVTGITYVGGLVGYYSGGAGGGASFIDSISSATVTGASYVGGLVGYYNGGMGGGATLTNNSSSGPVTGTNYVGGLLGYMFNSPTISGNTSSTVIGQDYVGGLVGFAQSGIISNSTASGTVSGRVNVGGLIGSADGVTLGGSTASGNVTGAQNVGGQIGQMNNLTYDGAGLALANTTVTGNDPGFKTVGGVIGVMTNSTLTNTTFGGTVNGIHNIGGLVGQANGGAISNSSFTGSITATGNSNDDLTLFGVGGLVGTGTTGLAISNSFNTGRVDGIYNVGGLEGTQDTVSSVTSSYNSGTVNGIYVIGGLVGWSDGAIANSYNNGAVMAKSIGGNDPAYAGNIGGLVGYAGWNGPASISNSFNSGAVTGAPGNGDSMGGLVGYMDSGTIATSYNAGAISGGNYVGGLTGYNNGAISNAYNTGAVTGSGTDIGGLVGRADYGSTISNDYSTGLVNGGGNVGGLVGQANGGAISNSNSSGNVTATGVNSGGLIGNADNVSLSGSSASGIVNGQNNVGGQIGKMQNMTFDGTGLGTLTANVSGNSNVGGVIGSMTSSTISNTTVSGSVTGAGECVGGLVGSAQSGIISNSTASGTVSGRVNVGGLIGSADGVTLGGSTASGNVTGVMATGGQIGHMENMTYNGAGLDLANITVTGSHVTTGGVIGLMINSTLTNTVFGGTVNGFCNVGGLVAQAEGGATISNSSFTGSLKATGDTELAFYFGGVGGLLGSGSETTISNSFNTGRVDGIYSVGGLAGYLTTSSVTNSHNSGAVSGVENVGGLIAYAESTTISNSNNSGAVTGRAVVGGLVGYGGSWGAISISDSHNSGVIASSLSITPGVYSTSDFGQTGGLVGVLDNASTIDHSYNTGVVNGYDKVGGLVGEAKSGAAISISYNAGAVSGGAYVGGLVGNNTGIISNAYNTGAVIGSGSDIGGVAGRADTGSTIINTYNTGLVNGGANVGGLIGNAVDGTVTASFFDTTTSGIATGVGIGSSAGVTGLATVDMMKTSTYSGAGWDTTTVWRSYDGHWYPLLKYWLTPIAVSANDQTKTYDGTSYSGGNGTNYSATPNGFLLGTGTYAGTSQGARNAGLYAIAPDVYSTAQQGGYDATITSGNLTINKVNLTVTANNDQKTYDGLAYNGGNSVTYSGLVNGETSSVLGGSLAYGGSSQGAVNGGNYTITASGLTSGNYNISYLNGNLEIQGSPVLSVPSAPPAPAPSALPIPQLQDQIVPLQSSLYGQSRTAECFNNDDPDNKCYDIDDLVFVVDGGVRRNETGAGFHVPTVSR